jgi:hypothetical protein
MRSKGEAALTGLGVTQMWLQDWQKLGALDKEGEKVFVTPAALRESGYEHAKTILFI